MRSDTITMEREIMELEAEIAALREKSALWDALIDAEIASLREKAALWDALAARLHPDSASWAESWDVYQGPHGKVVIQTNIGTFVEADTLEEAIRKAIKTGEER